MQVPPLGGEVCRLELVGGDKILNDADFVVESDHGDFSPERRQRVGGDLLFENLDPIVEGLNSAARHGARDVQQQDARATRLGVIDKFHHVLKMRMASGVVLHIPSLWHDLRMFDASRASKKGQCRAAASFKTVIAAMWRVKFGGFQLDLYVRTMAGECVQPLSCPDRALEDIKWRP